MMRKTVVTTLAATVVVAGLCGCAPDPFADPTPAPTPSGVVSGFASDEEAFAAAEATYRAYVDALNEVDLARPETFAAVESWLEGAALSDSQESLSELRVAGVSVVGDTTLHRVSRHSAGHSEVVLYVCLDVSAVDLVDSEGRSVTPDGRPDRQALEVALEPSSSPSGLVIVQSIATVSTVCQ